MGPAVPLKLYNTRTRKTELFTPIRDNDVRIYVCGLTPSAQAHLGHARSFLFFDLLRRYLAHCGYQVTYVQNVTDIDDRSIQRARETGGDWREIVHGYYRDFKAAMAQLGVQEPDFEPYATNYIPQIVEMIARLIESGHAYVSKDGVYYRVATFPTYGALSNRNIAELQSGARIEVDEFKDDPLDFALWKFAKPGEPQWEAPWGAGRPGWHIECSAMSRELLDAQGLGFDIHGGGADLIFPHHENEIAQSEPLMQHPPMANVWMHGGLLLFDNRKMSKSLGNFEPLPDLLARHDAQAIRLLFLQTGYRKVMNFTEESMMAATGTLQTIRKGYRALHQRAEGRSAPTLHATEQLTTAIRNALDDDMNTAVSLSKLLATASNTDALVAAHGGDAQAALGEFHAMLDLLGLTPHDSWLIVPPAMLPDDFVQRLTAVLGHESVPAGGAPEEALAAIIEARLAARARKDFSESDRLRNALTAVGIELKDSKEGTTWSVVV